jgi:hypothetical protein
MIECLSSKCKAVSSNPSTTKKKESLSNRHPSQTC